MKIPGMGIVTWPAKDAFRSLNKGFDLPSNVKEKGAIGFLDSFSPHIGGAATGAAIGAGAGMMLDAVDPVTSAVGGAAIGAAALPTIGLAGAGAFGLASGIWNNSDKIVNGVGKMGTGLGKAAYRGFAGPQFQGNTRTGKAAAEFGNRLLNPARRYAGTLNKISENFVDYEPRREVYNERKKRMVTKGGFKMKPLGWGVLGIGAAISSARGANNAYENSRTGERDPYITSATPRIPSYYDNAGASGDLVFALNANRRG